MEYTTDTADAVRAALTGRHEEAQQELANYRLAVATRRFCRELRELGGKGPDRELEEIEASDAGTSDRLELELLLVSSELGDAAPPDVTRIRAANLRNYIHALERQHAIHETYARLATASRNLEEAERQTVSALVLEGTHAAALAELDVLRPLEEAELERARLEAEQERAAAEAALEAERAAERSAEEDRMRAEAELEHEAAEAHRLELEELERQAADAAAELEAELERRAELERQSIAASEAQRRAEFAAAGLDPAPLDEIEASDAATRAELETLEARAKSSEASA